MRKYKHFFAEKTVRDLPEFAEVIARHPDIQWIDDYQNFREHVGAGREILHEKECVVFAKKRGVWLKPFYCYQHSDYQFLSLDLAEGCLFDCVYCYLQSYLNHGALVVFLGLPGLYQELTKLNSGSFWISTGLLSDSLLAEAQFPFLENISGNLPPNALLELRSKASDISVLESSRIVRNQIVVSWSLNPPGIVRNYEFRASSLEERLEAARRAIRLDYRIAFHLDPVFYFDGWQKAYEDLFLSIEEFPPNRIAFLSVGLFRYMPELGTTIRKRFPYHPILSGELFPQEDGKYHYFRAIRKEMYDAFSGWINRWEDVPVFWSMEPDASLYLQGIWDHPVGIE